MKKKKLLFVINTISAAGAAIIVVNGKSGVEVGAQKAWELCKTCHNTAE